MPNIKLYVAAAAGMLAAVWVHAAEPAAAPARHARVLAVGECPPFRQEIRDGVRYELEVPPDSIPPREVVVSGGKDAKPTPDAPPAAPVPIHLGRISPPVTVPDGAGLLDLHRAGAATDAKPWLRIHRPEDGDFLVLVWRDPTQPSWRVALGLSVPDGPAGAPAGTVRIVNLFPQAVRLQWADEPLLLPAGQSLVRSVRPGAATHLQILIADPAGGMKRYYSGTVTQQAGERGWVLIYRADGAAPRRPVKVELLREPAPPPPDPPH